MLEESKNPENLELQGLSFAELERAFRETQRLAATSFGQTENGFRNAQGEGIYIREAKGIFKLSEISPSLRDIHTFLATHPNSVLTNGSANKEEMMSAIKNMLEELGNRIIT